MLAAWLDAIGVLWCHVPNGGVRNPVAGAHLKAQGMKAGVPDVLIFTVPTNLDARGVAVELKRLKGGRATPTQKAWHGALRRVGWKVHVAHGALDAIDWLQALGYATRA